MNTYLTRPQDRASTTIQTMRSNQRTARQNKQQQNQERPKEGKEDQSQTRTYQIPNTTQELWLSNRSSYHKESQHVKITNKVQEKRKNGKEDQNRTRT